MNPRPPSGGDSSSTHSRQVDNLTRTSDKPLGSSSGAWKDPLVCRLIAKHRGRDPHSIVEMYAGRLLSEADQTQLPVDVETVASLLGIKRRLGPYEFAGRIFADVSGQLVMDLSTNDHLARRRFTCGHEIIHTIFPGFSREARYRVDVAVGHNTRERNEEEYLCDVGAAEILLPRELVSENYDSALGLGEIERLAEDASASLEASANRLVELARDPIGLIVLEVGHKPADRVKLRRGLEVPKKLRIRYATGRLQTYIPRFKSVSPDSPFAEALVSPGAVKAITTLPCNSAAEFAIEAKRYDRGTSTERVERVLALVRPLA